MPCGFHRRLLRALIAALSLMCSTVSASEPQSGNFQSIDSLIDAARRFAEAETGGLEDVQIEIRRPDPRLRLQRCSQSLEAFWPPGARHSGNVSLGVRCPGSKPWKLYMQATITVYEEVAVLTRAVNRGDSLSGDMIRMERQQFVSNRSRVREPQTLIGHRFRNSMQAGRALDPRQLEAPLLVTRGETVTLLSAGAGIEVRMSGEALDEGSLGSVIRVRNLSSQQIVHGRVTAAGVVKVSG